MRHPRSDIIRSPLRRLAISVVVVVELVPPVSDLDVIEVEVKVDDAEDLIMIGIRDHAPVVVDSSSTFDVRRSGLFLEDLVVDPVAFDAFDSFDVGGLYPVASFSSSSAAAAEPPPPPHIFT